MSERGEPVDGGFWHATADVKRRSRAVDAGRGDGFLVGGRRLSLRATAFRMRTEDTVSNVTVSTTPGLITRQRRNLGATRSQGVEVDAELRAGIATFQVGYLRADATVRSFEADPSLEGNRLPQVPRNQVP